MCPILLIILYLLTRVWIWLLLFLLSSWVIWITLNTWIISAFISSSFSLVKIGCSCLSFLLWLVIWWLAIFIIIRRLTSILVRRFVIIIIIVIIRKVITILVILIVILLTIIWIIWVSDIINLLFIHSRILVLVLVWWWGNLLWLYLPVGWVISTWYFLALQHLHIRIVIISSCSLW